MTPSQLIMLAFVLALFQPDETIRNYGMGEDVWQVTTLNGAPFAPRATLGFTGRYKLAGEAPCNKYQTTMQIPFPWFQTGAIAATKRSCPDQKAEQAFFDTLRAVRIAKVEDGVLILSDENAALMTLTPVD